MSRAVGTAKKEQLWASQNYDSCLSIRHSSTGNYPFLNHNANNVHIDTDTSEACLYTVLTKLSAEERRYEKVKAAEKK